jgi:hypothetical protein
MRWEHKDIVRMVSFDREVTNPTIKSKGEKVIEVPKGGHPKVTTISALTSLKWGEWHALLDGPSSERICLVAAQV